MSRPIQPLDIVIDKAVTFQGLLAGSVSYGALEHSAYPKRLFVEIEESYVESRESHNAPVKLSLTSPISFIVWMQMWLRLALGLEAEPKEMSSAFTKYTLTKVSHKDVYTGGFYKEPAHNLEAIMCFVPNRAGHGLTLNQYRERFTRLSVMGRLQIYGGLFKAIGVVLRSCRLGSDYCLTGQIAGFCPAPLKPD